VPPQRRLRRRSCHRDGTSARITPADRFYYGSGRIDRIDVASDRSPANLTSPDPRAGFIPPPVPRCRSARRRRTMSTASSSTSCYVRSPFTLQYAPSTSRSRLSARASCRSPADQFTYVAARRVDDTGLSLAGGYLGLNCFAPARRPTASTQPHPAALALPASLGRTGRLRDDVRLTLGCRSITAETVLSTARIRYFASATTTVSVAPGRR